MTKEFTIYTLFILLTVSMGVVFQFMLGRIKELNIMQKKIVSSMESLHKDMSKIKGRKRLEYLNASKKYSRAPGQVLRGDLTLEYNGAKADTKAVFMLDKE